MIRVDQIVKRHRILILTAMLATSCCTASAGLWYPGVFCPGWCCDPPRAYCTPECHPTWGHHQTCWRQFPPLQPCCGWGEYCAPNAAPQSCQTCQPGYSGPIDGQASGDFIPNGVITGGDGMLLNGNGAIQVMQAPGSHLQMMPNGANRVQQQILTPAPANAYSAQPAPAAGGSAPLLQNGASAPTPMPQSDLPLYPQQPAEQYPDQTYHYSVPAAGNIYAASHSTPYYGGAQSSGVNALPATYQNISAPTPAQPSAYIPAEQAATLPAQGPVGPDAAAASPLKPTWTEKAKDNAGRFWKWFRSPPASAQQSARSTTTPGQPVEPASTSRIQSIAPRISSWRR